MILDTPTIYCVVSRKGSIRDSQYAVIPDTTSLSRCIVQELAVIDVQGAITKFNRNFPSNIFSVTLEGGVADS